MLDPVEIWRNVLLWNAAEAARCRNPNQEADRLRFIRNMKHLERRIAEVLDGSEYS